MKNTWIAVVAAAALGLGTGCAQEQLDTDPGEHQCPVYEPQVKKVGVRYLSTVQTDGARPKLAPVPALGTAEFLEEGGHETVHLYEGDRIEWYCEGCPEGAQVKILDPHEVAVERAVDVALEIDRWKSVVGEALKATPALCEDEEDPEECRAAMAKVAQELEDGFDLGPADYIGHIVAEPAPDEQPKPEWQRLPFTGRPVPDTKKHKLIKFTWNIRAAEDAEVLKLDPHIHMHPNPPGD